MTYKCKCFKCGQEYESENELDLDENGYCLSCFEEKKAIAAEIDERLKNVRPRTTRAFDELPLIPGTNFIDYKKL